jgi:hypothetical protein
MVNKTLLSLAIAISTAGLTACNLSSTADSDAVATNPILAGQPGQAVSTTAVVFSAARGNVPVAIDLLFAEASTTDGTASTADTAPPVTTMINDLAGFSATASIDIAFNAALDPATVIAGSSVWLIELKSKEDNSLIDSLDLKTIVAAEPNPFSGGYGTNSGDQLTPGLHYVAEYVEMDNGATPTIRIHPLKPLDPKTKYIVAITDQLKDSNGITVVSSSEYAHTSGNDELVSAALAPVRGAVQGWEALAGGFIDAVTPNQTQDNVILSYAFTTEANDDILLAMAAPETYISSLLADTKTLEGILGEDTVALLVAGTAQGLNAANAMTEGWVDIDPSTAAGTLATRKTPDYKALVTSKVAQSIIAPGAAQSAAAALATAPSEDAADVTEAFTIWNDNNPTKPIPADPNNWVPADFDNIARALEIYDAETVSATYIILASNGAGALLKGAAKRPSAQTFTAIPNVVIPHSALGLPNEDAASMQGMLTLPQFMKTKSLADLSSFTDFWKGSTDVGDVIDGAFGNDAGTTPPKDNDNSLNVTYRFPFAQYVEDVKVPVLVTYPTGNDCAKPDEGWKTIIFQHGITTDRTSSLGFANSMSAATAGCFATVAMDLPTHGVDASSSDRNGTPQRYAAFNGFNVAGYVDSETPSNTPFAATLAGLAENSVTTFAGLAERHGNIALNAQQQPTPMVFTTGSESGNSGDFYINLSNMQQSRDHSRQAVMDILNLNASIGGMDIDNDTDTVDLDKGNLYFVGHSLGAITGLTATAVNNAVAKNDTITEKAITPFKAVVLANPGGQLPKLLENSPSFAARILPGLAAAGLTQGMADLETFFSIFQAPLDSIDPVNFTDLLKSTDTPVLMFEMVGGGLIDQDPNDGSPSDADSATTGLPNALIEFGGYPADTVVPNNANPALNDVATGLSYLTGTDPLIKQLELATVTGSISDLDTNLMIVSKLKEGTHGTISSADAVTVFAEMIGQTASFFATEGQGLVVNDSDQLQIPAP